MKPNYHFFLIILLVLCVPSPVVADYLSPTLRSQVDALKVSIQSEPSNASNVERRARIALAWVNAWSLTGKAVPVNMTAVFRPELPEAPRPVALRNFDAFLEQLVFMDEHPGAIGPLQADTGPFEARTWVTLEQTYTVGEMPVTPGGGFMVATHFMPGYGRLQIDDPGADNFVSIRSSNPDVTFVPSTAPMAGMHGAFRGEMPVPFYQLAMGTLAPGDTVTLRYGDQSGGSRGFLMSSASTDFLPLPVYVDLDGSGRLRTIPLQPIRVRGRHIAGVHVFAPSVVRPGDEFSISVRARDIYYNRAIGEIPGFEIRAGDRVLATTPPGRAAIQVIDGLSLPEGVWHITAVSMDQDVEGTGNPILVSPDARPVYWGDTHGHSGFAEGIGTPDRFMQWARDDARLDFVTHSEHDIWLDDAEWQQLVENVRRYSDDGRFTAFLGYEWTTRNLYGGHHNVLFRTPDHERLGTQQFPTLSRLYQGLRESVGTRDVLVIPHAHQAGDYRLSDPELEPLVEIMSQHGTFEWFGRMYLSHGHRVGFIAASDNHLSQPGYTSPKGASLAQRGGLAAIMAESSSRNAIFDAMKGLHAYATTGDRIILDFNVNGTPMGQRTKYDTTRRITGRVIGTAPIDELVVIRNGQEIWRQTPGINKGDTGDRETLHVTFESDSTPYHPNDNPRGGRVWRGALTVHGATLESFSATDYFNPEVNELRRDPDDPNRILFSGATRGDTSSIRLDLTGVSRRTRLSLELKETREVGGGPTVFRPAQTIPASNHELAVRDIEEGELRVLTPFDGYGDSITVRRIVTAGPRDVSFELVDEHDRQGDYYFVRVRQVNDAVAWSSPIWVGGYDKR